MKRPLTGLVVVYAAGIWVGSIGNWSVPVLFWSTLALMVFFLAAMRSRHSTTALLAVVFSTGILAYRHATAFFPPNHIARLLEARDQNIGLRGVIVSPPGNRTNETAATDPLADRQSFQLAVEALQRGEQWQPATGKLLIFVSASRPPERFRYGDEIECSALLRVPPPARNPGTFDWRRWLTRQGIPFTATIRKADVCVILAGGRGNPVTALSLRLRERFERALRLGLESEPELAGVLAGMVIGQRAEIPPDTYADFQQTGVFHVFAINGLHVGLVTLMALMALRAARMPRRWCAVVAVPVLVLYVFATGAHPGAVRALIMASVWLFGWMLLRPADSLSNLATAALAILIWNPTELLDGGFILSFAVVLAIVVMTPRIEARLLPWGGVEPLLPRQFVSSWRRRWDQCWRWGVRLLSCSIAAWIGLVPLLAGYFHLFTPVSIVANLVVIPLLSLVIATGLAATLAHGFVPWLALTFNNANFLLVNAMVRAVEWLGWMSIGHWFVQAPPLWAVIGYYVLLVLFLSRRITWPHKRLTLAVAAVTLGLSLAVPAWLDRGVEITTLDLRDGAAVFVNLPGERADCLIDGGSDWSGERVVVPFLRAQGVDRLNAIVLTRGDKAHAAGLDAVMRQMPVGRAIHGGTGSRSRFFWEWLETARRRQLEITTVRAGDSLDFGSAMRGRVLNPSSAATSNRSDENAVVLLLECGGTRVLLMSDAGETMEQRLLASGADLRAQIILKGRPSKEASCTDAFLDAVRPELVVQSVSVRPSDRYLQPDLRERLQQRGIRLCRTDETGAVTIRLQQDGYTVRTWLATGMAGR